MLAVRCCKCGESNYVSGCCHGILGFRFKCRKQADKLERAWWEEHGQFAAAKGQTLDGEERSTTWQASLVVLQSCVQAMSKPACHSGSYLNSTCLVPLIRQENCMSACYSLHLVCSAVFTRSLETSFFSCCMSAQEASMSSPCASSMTMIAWHLLLHCCYHQRKQFSCHSIVIMRHPQAIQYAMWQMLVECSAKRADAVHRGPHHLWQ